MHMDESSLRLPCVHARIHVCTLHRRSFVRPQSVVVRAHLRVEHPSRIQVRVANGAGGRRGSSKP